MEKLIKSKNGQWTLVKGAAPKLDLGHSVFTMDHVNEVANMKDHNKAKEYAHKIVDESNAKPHNVASIKQMINKSKNTRDLMFGMSNHVLAHPSEGLRVLKRSEDESEKQNDLEKIAPLLAAGLGFSAGKAISKEDVSVAPKPSNPKKGGKGTNEMAKDEDKDNSNMMFSDLEQISHHIQEIRGVMKPSEDCPDWVKAQITEAAKNLSDVAHYIQGKKSQGGK